VLPAGEDIFIGLEPGQEIEQARVKSGELEARLILDDRVQALRAEYPS
jgi:hypothetical protein